MYAGCVERPDPVTITHWSREGKMPFVQVKVWEGFGEENTRTVIKEITDVFTRMGKPASSVRVLVEEVPKTNWGIAGKPASEK